MSSAMDPPRVDNLFGIHRICVKSGNFLRGNVGIFNLEIIFFLVGVLLAIILRLFVESLYGIVKLILLVYGGPLSLEKVILCLAIIPTRGSNPVVPI